MGTGIMRIRNALAGAGIEEPVFTFDSFFTVEFPRQTSVKTSVKILEYMGENPEVTIPELAQELELTPRAIELQIAQLKEKGKIERIGPAKGGYWQVKD